MHLPAAALPGAPVLMQDPAAQAVAAQVFGRRVFSGIESYVPRVVTSRESIGAQSPTATPLLHINANGTGSNVTDQAGTLLHLSQADGVGGRITMDCYGATPVIGLRRAAGTAAAKTAVQADQILGAISGYGYGATAYSSGDRARFFMFAAENWSDSAQGTYLVWSTTPTGGTTVAERMRLDAGGQLLLQTAGKGLSVKEGSNAKMGTATLVAGSSVVSNTSVTANSRILLTSQADGGTPGFLRVSARVAGTSFTVTSSSATDTSTVAYLILEPS